MLHKKGCLFSFEVWQPFLFLDILEVYVCFIFNTYQ